MRLFISALALMLLFGFKTTDTVTLTVKISNFKNTKGKIGLGLYNAKKQFTDNPWKYYRKSKSEAVKGTLTMVLKDLPKGTYAISFLDDENENDKMDYAFLGFPKEGFGFSNNAKPGTFSAPSYEDCTITLNNHKEIQLSVQYWNN